MHDGGFFDENGRCSREKAAEKRHGGCYAARAWTVTDDAIEAKLFSAPKQRFARKP
jgi:hypothetical protein